MSSHGGLNNVFRSETVVTATYLHQAVKIEEPATTEDTLSGSHSRMEDNIRFNLGYSYLVDWTWNVGVSKTTQGTSKYWPY